VRSLKRGFGVGLGLANLLSLVLAAGSGAELRKLPPYGGTQPYPARLRALIESRYPQLLTGPPADTPVITVLFNADGTVGGTYLETPPKHEVTLTASEVQFSRFGLSAGDLQYIGVGRVQLPGLMALVVFGAKTSRDLDRALVAQYFPQALVPGAPLPEGLWILFDREGRVLRTGTERIDPTQLRATLEARFPGTRMGDLTVTPVFGRDGRPLETSRREALELTCVWLAEGSPLPEQNGAQARP